MIRIGYVGSNTALPTASRTFRIAGYSEERMLSVSRSNILALENILMWNLERNITLFRVTSNLIPYASSPLNSGSWKEVFHPDFVRIGRIIRASGMRVSMHPGQFTVLSTPVETFYSNTLRELDYHDAVLSLMGLDSFHKIIIHGGGAYGNKEYHVGLLLERLDALPSPLRRRLVLENDEKVYNAAEVLDICRRGGLPGLFDVFHHEVLPSLEGMTTRQVILLFAETWSGERQKVHYSNQDPARPKGAHSETIDVEQFRAFYESVRDLDLDIMLEVKDKQASVLKLKQAFPDIK